MVLVVFSINRLLCCSAYLQPILRRFSSVKPMIIDLLYTDKTQHLSYFFVFVILVYGKDVKALIEQPLEAEPMHPGKNTVTYEARLLKSLLLQLI